MFTITICPLISMFIFCSECRDGIRSILTDTSHMKMSRDNALRALLDTASEKLSQQRHNDNDEISSLSFNSNSSLLTSTFWSLCGQELQSLALDTGLR